MKQVRNSIDLAFLKNSKVGLDELEKKLLKEGIAVIYKLSSQGLIYGITYVDHTTKCVFNGSALGVQYAAKAMLERCSNERLKPDLNNYENKMQKEEGIKNPAFISENELQKIIDSILQPEYAAQYIPANIKGRRKKRKRKGQSDN